jgi:hypothetical protein
MKSAKTTAVVQEVACRISHKDAEKDILAIMSEVEGHFFDLPDSVEEKLLQSVKSFCMTLEDFDTESATFRRFVKVRACSTYFHCRPRLRQRLCA